MAPTTPVDRRADQQERRQVAVDIAVLQTEVATLVRDMAAMKEVNRQQSEKLDMLLQKMSEARGGWATMMWIGGAFAGLGGTVTLIIDYILKVPPK